MNQSEIVLIYIVKIMNNENIASFVVGKKCDRKPEIKFPLSNVVFPFRLSSLKSSIFGFQENWFIPF